MSTNNTEESLIHWLNEQLKPVPPVEIGIGDDCALIQNRHPILISTDMLLDSSCFLLHEAGGYKVGKKAMNVNLSDIAAMAGIPFAATISLGLPRQQGFSLAQTILKGVLAAAEPFQVQIIGGDTNSWEGKCVVSVTIFGWPGKQGAVKRSGAKPGDWIMVTGELGGSILGKHLDFQPRIREASQLANGVSLHSMIDISDGLALDLHRICEASHCGARLFAEKIPISSAAITQSAQDGKSALDHALHDGEDFELLFTVSSEDGKKLLIEEPISPIKITHIGEIIDNGFWLQRNNRDEILLRIGYEHTLN